MKSSKNTIEGTPYTLYLCELCRFLEDIERQSSIELSDRLPLIKMLDQPYVSPHKLKVGHIIIIMSQDASESWVHAKVTHIYKNYVFYEITEGRNKGKEIFTKMGSPFYNEFVLPARIIIPKDCKFRFDKRAPIEHLEGEVPILSINKEDIDWANALLNKHD